MNPSMVRIVSKDKGFDALLAEMKKSNKSLAVGIMSPESGETYIKAMDPTDDLKVRSGKPRLMHTSSGPVTVYDIAVWNEFGTTSSLGNVQTPARPFLSGTIDSHQTKYADWARKVALAVLDKRETIQTGLSKMGEMIVADIQQRIIAHIPPENADYTKKMKGSSTPLIDTGHLLHSIKYEVRSPS